MNTPQAYDELYGVLDTTRQDFEFGMKVMQDEIDDLSGVVVEFAETTVFVNDDNTQLSSFELSKWLTDNSYADCLIGFFLKNPSDTLARDIKTVVQKELSWLLDFDSTEEAGAELNLGQGVTLQRDWSKVAPTYNLYYSNSTTWILKSITIYKIRRKEENG